MVYLLSYLLAAANSAAVANGLKTAWTYSSIDQLIGSEDCALDCPAPSQLPRFARRPTSSLAEVTIEQFTELAEVPDERSTYRLLHKSFNQRNLIKVILRTLSSASPRG